MKIKVVILLSLILLSFGSFVGYLILNRLIIGGSLKVAAGQIQIAQGEKRLSSGKARLASGEHELESGKKSYGASQGALLAVSAVFPAALAVSAVAGRQVFGNKLAEGEKEVAAGKKKVSAGEQQLAEGKQELARGIGQLNRAKLARTACGMGTALFASLTLICAYFWRRSLLKRS